MLTERINAFGSRPLSFSNLSRLYVEAPKQYMRRFVLGWKKLGLEQRLGSRIVTYADDLVILCKKGNADQALQQLRKIMSKLKLTVNEEKTRICRIPEGEFDFLGYTFGRMFSERTGQARLGYRPKALGTLGDRECWGDPER